MLSVKNWNVIHFVIVACLRASDIATLKHIKEKFVRNLGRNLIAMLCLIAI